MPLLPSLRARQFSAVPTPSGETKPTPVSTTRRRSGKLKRRVGSRGRSVAAERSVLVPGVLLDVLDGVLDGADLLGVLVRDLDPELLLERHYQLDDVERVGAQVVGEARFHRHLVGIDAELLDDDVLDPV